MGHHHHHEPCPQDASNVLDPGCISGLASVKDYVTADLLPGCVAMCDVDVSEDASSPWASRGLTLLRALVMAYIFPTCPKK